MQGVDPDSGLQFDSYDMALNTAMQGLGVALGMEPFVNRDLDAGMLVEPFPNRRVFTMGDWFLVCRKERADTEKVVSFRAWLLQEIDRDPAMLDRGDSRQSSHAPLRAVQSD